jgi:hypothetical protein
MGRTLPVYGTNSDGFGPVGQSAAAQRFPATCSIEDFQADRQQGRYPADRLSLPPDLPKWPSRRLEIEAVAG